MRVTIAALFTVISAAESSALEGSRLGDPARCVRPKPTATTAPAKTEIGPQAEPSRRTAAVAPTGEVARPLASRESAERLVARVQRPARPADVKARQEAARSMPAVPGLGALLRLGQNTLRDISWLFDSADSSSGTVIAGHTPPACAAPPECEPATEGPATGSAGASEPGALPTIHGVPAALSGPAGM